jgi:hypothetical protein
VLLLLVCLHIAALDAPLVALPLQRVVHRDGLRSVAAFRPEADLGIGLFFAERNRIDADIHGLHVDFFGDVFDDALFHRLGRVDVFRAARETQRGEADWAEFHVPIIPAARKALDCRNKGTMTDPQMMTLALAIIIPLSMLLYSNSRITEAKETLRAEMVALRETLRAEMSTTKETLRAEIAAGFARMSSEILSLKADLKIHELEHHHK